MFQRKWVSAAVLTLLSGAAAAQSSVTIYGRVDTGIVTGKFDSTGNRTLVQSGPYTASRLGFRGTEDLGGGLRASFGLEAGLNIDTGTGGATGGGLNFNRGSQVALASDSWGEFALGKMYMPTFWVYLAADPGIGGLGLGSMGASIMQQHTALTGKTVPAPTAPAVPSPSRSWPRNPPYWLTTPCSSARKAPAAPSAPASPPPSPPAPWPP